MGALFGGGANTQNVIRYSSLQVSTSQLDIPITLFWGQRRISPNVIWYNNFQSHKASAGKGGGKGQGYTYSAAVILALGEGVMSTPVNVWGPSSTTTTTTLSALGLAFATGTSTQTAWSYVTTNYPSQALAYMNTAYVYSSNLNLGSSASVPDYAFEIQRLNGFTNTLTAPGWTNPTTGGNTAGTDVSLADVIPDFLTNATYGMGFSSGDLADMTLFTNYQSSQGLYFSPLLTSQEKATQVLDRWAALANSWIYWSGTQIQFVPLGDSSLSANGYTYTPDLSAAYNLTLSDFVVGKKGGVPVEVTRADPADCYNRTVLEITDRTRGYVSSPVEYKDQHLVAAYGLRDNSSTQAHDVCNPAVGAIVAQLIGRRAAYIRNTYKFKLSYRYIRLLPGSIVTLTEPNIGLSAFPVRIRTIDEDEQGVLSILAEELPAGIGTYFSQNTPPATTATTVNTTVDPGSVNTPAVCEPASTFAQGQSVALIAASGGSNWGGAHVYLSLDGSNYSQIGTIESPALQGTLTGNLASYSSANPDNAHTLAVDVTESAGTFPAASSSTASNATTLCYVSPQPTSSGGNEVLSSAGELLAFGAVSSTGTYTANLTTLYRGLYGTSGNSHSTGDQFTLFDVSDSTGSTIRFPLPVNYIGQTLYLKFQSFNIFGNAAQDLSTVTSYTYTPAGKTFGQGTSGVPSQPTGFGGIVQSSQVLLAWTANPAQDTVTSYAVYRGSGTSTAFASCSLVWAGAALTFTDTNVNLVTGYTYYVVAINAAGDSIPSAGFNATTAGINNGQVLQSGSFSGVSGGSVDFNPQVLACGFLEISVWAVESPSNINVNMVFRNNGADMTGVTYYTVGNGANSSGSSGFYGGAAAAEIFADIAGGTGVGMSVIRLWVGGSGHTPRMNYASTNDQPGNFSQQLGSVIPSGISATPTGFSLYPQSGTFSFSYAIKGFLA
jgi:hypothetical protein